jgi:hypothetical protein
MCDKQKDTCDGCTVPCKCGYKPHLLDGPKINLKPFLFFLLVGLLLGATSSDNPFKTWAW